MDQRALLRQRFDNVDDANRERLAVGWRKRSPRTCFVLIAAVSLLVTACTTSDALRQEDPCPGTSPTSLGEPENLDNSYATFELVAGPVWVTVTRWEPGPATSVPFTVPFFIGSMSAPPEEPDSAVALLADQVLDVVEGQYTRVDLPPGTYWVLTNSVVGETAVVACDGGEVGEVDPAP